jgi:hypothetical protein
MNYYYYYYYFIFHDAQSEVTTPHTPTTKVIKIAINVTQLATLKASTQGSTVLAVEVWLTFWLGRSCSVSSPQAYTLSCLL